MMELKGDVPLCAHGVILTETSASWTLPKDRKASFNLGGYTHSLNFKRSVFI